MKKAIKNAIAASATASSTVILYAIKNKVFASESGNAIKSAHKANGY